MDKIPMGQLSLMDHDSKTISGALDIQQRRFDEVFEEITTIYNEETKVSRMTERCVRGFQDSELALALMLLGIIRERGRPQD